jgi:hypothetical protein
MYEGDMLKILQVLRWSALVAILTLSVGAIDAAFAQTPVPYHRSVPGPIAGAGLPIAIVGYGAYWLVRRYRRKSQ